MSLLIIAAMGFSLLEARLINVVARIIEVEFSPVGPLEYGAVFPQEKLDKTFSITLSQSFIAGAGTVNSGLINYVIKQRPECVNNSNPNDHPRVDEVSGNFVCPAGSHLMPFLCPYLSKHEITADGTAGENDGLGLNAFHGLPNWTAATTLTLSQQTYGHLSAAGNDLADQWDINLDVPCFNGSCAQDWPDFVKNQSGNPGINPADYTADPASLGVVYGCDLWIEDTSNFFVGNDVTIRSEVDTRSDFTIVDTNHPASGAGTLTLFQYYAGNLNPFRFIVVDTANVVKWVSPQLTPLIVGVNTVATSTAVQAGWNVGLYFANTGTIPYASGGALDPYTFGGSGVPIMGNTLVIDNSVNRTYSFIAY